LKHDRRWQTDASARFAFCTLGLSRAALKGEVVSCQLSVLNEVQSTGMAFSENWELGTAAFEQNKRPGCPGLKSETE
jgi:hypothetical protein